MNNEWLFVTRDEYTTTNIPDSYMPAKLQMLKTRHMTLTATGHNTEFYIQLRRINLGECTATFDVGLYGHITSFKIGIDDDPIIRFIDDEPGMEFHVFENACSYEINNHIKTNTLYKLQKQGSTDFQLVITTNVTSHAVNFNELRFPNNTKCVVMGYNKITTEPYDIDMYKEYIVTEIGPFNLIKGENKC